jgi:hypothetical protein
MQGDIPKMALVTGNVDELECVIRKTGLADAEFDNPGGTGQVDFYHGDGSGGVKINSSTPNESTLVDSQTQLAKYDMVMFPCQGGQYNQSSTDLANILNYADIGGRIFATHYSYVWLYNNPTSSTGFGSAATWDINQGSPTPDPGMATVNTNFSGGSTLSQWLQNGGLSTTLSQIEVSTLRLDQTGVVAPTQSWLTLNTNNTSGEIAHPVMQMTFNTPVGATAGAQCGRVLFNEYHVANASGTNGQTFPSECPSGAMTPQEKLLEYALFDLSTAITPVVAPTVSQSYVNYSPTTTPNTDFTQNDTADTITDNVTNTSSTVGLSSSIVLTLTLPTGVTATAITDPTGGWTCTVSTLTCTRTTPIAPSASDSIIITTSVASNAPTGSGGSLTSTISGGGLSSNVNGTDPLTILAGQQPQAITFNPSTPVTYGVAPITLSATGGASGNPVVYSIVSGNGTLSGPNNDILTVTGVGPIVIAANQAGNSSYTAAPQVEKTITVNPAVLTVTAQPASKTYGAANPTLTDVITGFVNGDSSSVVSGAASLTTTATTSSSVGTYPITAAQGTLAASNYTFVYVPATLTVTQPAAAINWPTPAAITYGTPLSATQLDAAYTCGGQTVAGSYSYTPALGTVLNAGSQTLSVTFTPTDLTDCPVTTTTVGLTVNPAVLTVTAQPASKTYGSANPTFTDVISGFVNGQNSSVVTGVASLSTTATTSSSAGSYPITAAQGSLSAANYTFSYVPSTLTVNPAVLTVTAQNATRPYDTANPTFTDVITGFVNGDSSSVVSGAASLATSATLTSSVGSYPITAAQGSLSAANYTFNFASGTLQITQLPQVITFTAPSSVPLASGPITLNGTGGGSGNPVTYTVTGPATVSGNVLTFTGVGTVTVTANQAGNTNYSAAAPVVQTINMVQPPVDSQVTLSFSNTVPPNSTTWSYPGEANADMCVTTTTGKFATGQIELLDGTTVLTTQTLQPGGCADWYITPGLNAGTHYFTAYYLGDGVNPAGYSNLIVITVSLFPSQLEVDCWNASFAYGADYQCDANPDDPAILPGGITYSVNGAAAVTVPFNKVGHSLWSLSKPTVGSYTMTINYPQTTNYAAYALPTQHFTVTPADVELGFLPDNWSPSAGDHVMLQASVASSSAGPPNGIGSVTFYDGSRLLATVAVDSNGNANYTTTFTSGMHNLKATYAGANYSTTSTTIQLGVQ